MCNEVLVGNKVGVVSCTARNQFAAEAGIFIDLEHVHADVGHAGIDHVGERKVPALKVLVRQSGDEIDIDISIPAPRRRAISSITVVRVCRRPTDRDSWSMNDCAPRLTRLTPHRGSRSSNAGVSVPGAHSTVMSDPGCTSKFCEIVTNSRCSY